MRWQRYECSLDSCWDRWSAHDLNVERIRICSGWLAWPAASFLLDHFIIWNRLADQSVEIEWCITVFNGKRWWNAVFIIRWNDIKGFQRQTRNWDAHRMDLSITWTLFKRTILQTDNYGFTDTQIYVLLDQFSYKLINACVFRTQKCFYS